MKKYRISGYMGEVGAVQVDIEAKNKKEAIKIANDKYNFSTIIGITKIN
jgi:hypothetical protein